MSKTFEETVNLTVTGKLRLGANAELLQLDSARNEKSLTPTSEAVVATNIITADETGKTFFLNIAGGFTSTLPLPQDGLKFRFVVKTAPTTAYIILTNASANIIHGVISTGEDAAGSVVTAAAADTVNFVANLAIIGDYVDFESDGDLWYINGMTSVQDGITTVQAS